MKLGSILTLVLVNGILSVLLFAASIMGYALLDGGDPTAGPALIAVIVTVVGPAMLVFNLIAALIASLARRSSSSAHLVAMIVAGCMAVAFIGFNRAVIAPTGDPVWLVRLAFVAALMLPWAFGAGAFRTLGRA